MFTQLEIKDSGWVWKYISYQDLFNSNSSNVDNTAPSTNLAKSTVDAKRLWPRMQSVSYIVKRNCFTDDTSKTPTVVLHWLSHRWRYFSGFTHLTNLNIHPKNPTSTLTQRTKVDNGLFLSFLSTNYVCLPEVCCRNSEVQSETIICCGSFTLYSWVTTYSFPFMQWESFSIAPEMYPLVLWRLCFEIHLIWMFHS